MNNPKRIDIFNNNYERRKNEFVYSKITTLNQNLGFLNKENNKNIVNYANNRENTNNKRIIKEDNATIFLKIMRKINIINEFKLINTTKK